MYKVTVEYMKEWVENNRTGTPVIKFGDTFFDRSTIVGAVENVLNRMESISVGIDYLSPSEIVFLHILSNSR